MIFKFLFFYGSSKNFVWYIALWRFLNWIRRGKKSHHSQVGSLCEFDLLLRLFFCLEAYRTSLFSSWNPQVSCINIGDRKHYPPTGYNLCVDPRNPPPLFPFPYDMESTVDNPISSSFRPNPLPVGCCPTRIKSAVRYLPCNFLPPLPNSTFRKPIPGGMKSNNLRLQQHARVTNLFYLYLDPIIQQHKLLREVTVFRFPCERWITPPLMVPNFVRRSIVSFCFCFFFVFYFPGVSVRIIEQKAISRSKVIIICEWCGKVRVG